MECLEYVVCFEKDMKYMNETHFASTKYYKNNINFNYLLEDFTNWQIAQFIPVLQMLNLELHVRVKRYI